MANLRILDIGCGKRKVSGAIGIDKIFSPNIDVVCELDKYNWPFHKDSFDEIHAIHVMEHMEDPIHFMNEIHRVGKEGCHVFIRTPHKSHIESFRDPTHKHHFVAETFDYFDVECSLSLLYGQKQFRLKKKQVVGLSTIGKLLFLFLSLRHWERHWSPIFPAKEIVVELQVSKQ